MISFTALVGYDTLFSPKIEHEVGKFNHKTAQNETPVGNGLCVGSIFLIISLTELPALICAKKRHSPSLPNQNKPYFPSKSGLKLRQLCRSLC